MPNMGLEAPDLCRVWVNMDVTFSRIDEPHVKLMNVSARLVHAGEKRQAADGYLRVRCQPSRAEPLGGPSCLQKKPVLTVRSTAGHQRQAFAGVPGSQQGMAGSLLLAWLVHRSACAAQLCRTDRF